MKRKTLIALAIAAAFAAPLAYAGYTTDEQQKAQDLIKVSTSALSLIMMVEGDEKEGSESSQLVAEGEDKEGSESADLIAEGEDKEGSESADLIAEGEDKEGSESADLIA